VVYEPGVVLAAAGQNSRIQKLSSLCPAQRMTSWGLILT